MELDGLRPWAGLEQVPLAQAQVVVAGVAYDDSAVYRRGSAAAPSSLRALSACLPPVSERGCPMSRLRLHDLGDLTMSEGVEAGWVTVAERLTAIPEEALLTVVGGDHCAAIPVMAAQARRHPDLALLWLDAHPDLNDSSRGGRWTCGCALRRGLEVSRLEPSSVALVGCRDFDPEEVEYINHQGMLLITAAELADDPVASTERLTEYLAGRRLHISFDIDVLDPAYAPGTEIAVAGGLSTRQALHLLATVTQHSRVVGFDIYEVIPQLDQSDITLLAALKLIFESWAHYQRQLGEAG
ncbi:MAG: arginase family protein [Candidatus Dormibacteraceae bacterium]